MQNRYKIISKIGDGTFSEVFKAMSTKTGKLVAIKRMKQLFRSKEQVNSLREIQALKRLENHPNMIQLLEVLYDRNTGRLALVFELMTCNLYEIIRGRKEYLAESKVKMYIYQMLRALEFLHRNGIFHRDIKPENVLVADDLTKLADFGSCRGIYTKQPFSEYISTRWYRAPECLLTDGYYNYKMDIWGAGCVLFEILMLYPLFPGSDELDQIHRIHAVLGTPSKELLSKFKQSAHMDFNFPVTEGAGLKRLLKNAPAELTDLLTHMLSYDPDERYNARQCLKHPYFRELREADRRSQQILSQSSEAHPQTRTSVNSIQSFQSTQSHSLNVSLNGSESTSARSGSLQNIQQPQANVVTLPGAVSNQSGKQKQLQSHTDIHSLPPLSNAVSSENISNQQSGSTNTNFMSSSTSPSSQLPSLNDTHSSFSGNQADKSGAQQSGKNQAQQKQQNQPLQQNYKQQQAQDQGRLQLPSLSTQSSASSQNSTSAQPTSLPSILSPSGNDTDDLLDNENVNGMANLVLMHHPARREDLFGSSNKKEGK